MNSVLRSKELLYNTEFLFAIILSDVMWNGTVSTYLH